MLLTLVANSLAQTFDIVCPGAWNQVSSSGPAPRVYHTMAFEPRGPHGHVVLFGGTDTNINRKGDTWTWDGTVWIHAANAGPVKDRLRKASQNTELGVQSRPVQKGSVMKNFHFRSEEIKGDVDTMDELHQQFTTANVYPKRLILRCNVCLETRSTGPAIYAGELGAIRQSVADRKWADHHRHHIQKWFAKRAA